MHIYVYIFLLRQAMPAYLKTVNTTKHCTNQKTLYDLTSEPDMGFTSTTELHAPFVTLQLLYYLRLSLYVCDIICDVIINSFNCCC